MIYAIKKIWKSITASANDFADQFRFSQNYKDYLSNKDTYDKMIDIEKYYTS